LTRIDYKCNILLKDYVCNLLTNLLNQGAAFMDKSKSSRISDAEWQVMNVIWDTDRTTSQAIVKQLKAKTNWSEMTIKTLIGRLVKKKVAGYEVDKNDKRIYYYYPIIKRDQCIRDETNIFLKKFYNGALSSMLSSFVKKNELTREEMDELIKILESGKKKEE